MERIFMWRRGIQFFAREAAAMVQRPSAIKQTVPIRFSSSGSTSAEPIKSRWKYILFGLGAGSALTAVPVFLGGSLKRKLEQELDVVMHPAIDKMLKAINNAIQAGTALAEYGLIETKWLANRTDEEQINLYRQAEKEIVIVCNSGGGRFVNNANIWDALCDKAKNGVKLKILLTNPTSSVLNEKQQREARLLLDKIKIFNSKEETNKIEIKCLDDPPSFNADFIDANIEEKYSKNDKAVFILMPKVNKMDPSRILIFKYIDIGEKIGDHNRRALQDTPYIVFRDSIREIWRNAPPPSSKDSMVTPKPQV